LRAQQGVCCGRAGEVAPHSPTTTMRRIRENVEWLPPGGSCRLCAQGLAENQGRKAGLAAPNGLELSRSAEAGGATHTLALAGDQGKPHADSAE